MQLETGTNASEARNEWIQICFCATPKKETPTTIMVTGNAIAPSVSRLRAVLRVRPCMSVLVHYSKNTMPPPVLRVRPCMSVLVRVHPVYEIHHILDSKTDEVKTQHIEMALVFNAIYRAFSQKQPKKKRISFFSCPAN